MKLIKCYIENFGKLQNFSYEFRDGLNVIKQENGFGKTTFSNFIKSMFYGLDASKSEKSERKIYKPWQGGNFGGNIDFKINGKEYRIERFFGTKASDDTFKLYNLNTNLESHDFSENIGEEIFKINKSGYERSTYIPQGQIQIDMEDSINAKLGNVLESDNDMNSSDEAIKRLSDTLKIYIKTGNKGLINEKQEKLNNLERLIENNKFDLTNIEIKKKRLNEIKIRLEELEKEKSNYQKLLSEKIEQDRKKAKIETYTTILENLKENQKRQEEIKKELESSEKELELRVKEIDSKLQDKTEEIEKLNRENKKAEQSKKKKIKNKAIIISISLIAIAIGVILLLQKHLQMPGIITIVFGITGISLALMKFNVAQTLKMIEEIKEKKESLEKNIVELNTLKSETENSIERLEKHYKNEFEAVSLKIQRNENQKKEFEEANDILKLEENEEKGNINEKELTEKISEAERNLDRLNDEKNQLKNQIEVLENKIDENDDLEIDFENLKTEIQEMKNRYEVLEKTKTLLEEAKTSFSANYLKEMTDEFDKYFEFVSNQKHSTNVDTNLDVKLDVNGKQKEVKYFSAGYKDLVYICMRLSLIKAIFKDEKPFVILDDPFVNLDEEKAENASKLVKKLSEDYQTIYFTCNISRKIT